MTLDPVIHLDLCGGLRVNGAQSLSAEIAPPQAASNFLQRLLNTAISPLQKTGEDMAVHI